MSDEMRGLFFIVKGQYAKGVAPSFVNKVNNEVSHIGGYDPYSDNTEKWYMLMDRKTFNCIACGSDYDKVLKGVYNTIVRYKGQAKKYFKHISNTSSDDYYETHYLGRRPLTHEERVKKAEGRCPRVSPVMRCLYEHIDREYGEFFNDDIEMMEDLAYNDLREEKPYRKVKKLVSKTKMDNTKVEMTPPKKEVINTSTTKLVKPKMRRGIKKLSLK